MPAKNTSTTLMLHLISSLKKVDTSVSMGTCGLSKSVKDGIPIIISTACILRKEVPACHIAIASAQDDHPMAFKLPVFVQIHGPGESPEAKGKRLFARQGPSAVCLDALSANNYWKLNLELFQELMGVLIFPPV